MVNQAIQDRIRQSRFAEIGVPTRIFPAFSRTDEDINSQPAQPVRQLGAIDAEIAGFRWGDGIGKEKT
jgi:hypothetical protein